MRRIGSITKFFRYLDEETTSTMKSILDSSNSYPEFVTRFSKCVVEHDSSESAVIIAATLARGVRRYDIVQEITKKYAGFEVARPFLALPDGWTEADRIQMVKEVLEAEVEDWIRIRLLTMLCAPLIHSQNPFDAQIAEETLLELKDLVEKNEKDEYLELSLIEIKRRFEEVKGDHQAEIRLCNEGLELARSLDDPVSVAGFHLGLAYLTRNFDISKATEHERELKRLIDSLGLDYLREEWLRAKGNIHNTRGEFSVSLENYLEAVRERQLTHSFMSLRYIPNVLAIINIEIGEYADALEWATMAIEDDKFQSVLGSREASANLLMAMALAGLGRIGDAELHLEKAKKMLLEMGSFFGSATYEGMIPYATGFIEMARGNIE
ncbi:MAG: tetratricopeptide repeat protein, partial [Candidatus Thorarchaeota archaeon]